jgi:hypothetical protein
MSRTLFIADHCFLHIQSLYFLIYYQIENQQQLDYVNILEELALKNL